MIKKLLFTILLTALPFSVSMADDVRVFVGVEYDSDEKTFYNTVGSIQHISGGLYAIERAVIGRYGSLETDMMYKFNFQNSDFSVGILAGPSADFIGSQGDGVGPTAYIVGGAGLMASWLPANKLIGVSVGAKYKLSFEGDNAYQSGFQGGLFISYRFGE